MHRSETEAWRVTLVDTGDATMTGGRLRRVLEYAGEEFCLTYGDGVADIDIGALIAHHREQGMHCTVTSVQPLDLGARFSTSTATARAWSFEEKPRGDGAWMNGGFFVCSSRGVGEYIDGGRARSGSRSSRAGLARDGQLACYRHEGFWHAMGHSARPQPAR